MKRIHVGLVLLSFAAGAADAFAFIALGGIFTANMTGNLILAGMFTRPEFGQTLVAAGLAIVCFAGVLYAAFRLTRAATKAVATSGRVVRRLLLPSLAIQLTVVVVWASVPMTGGMVERLTVIALSASALALQTVAARRLSDVEGVTTTYVTGTLTTTMEALAERRGDGQLVRVLSIVALVVGAVAGTTALLLVPPVAPVVTCVAAAAATGVLWSESRRPKRDTVAEPSVAPQ